MASFFKKIGKTLKGILPAVAPFIPIPGVAQLGGMIASQAAAKEQKKAQKDMLRAQAGGAGAAAIDTARTGGGIVAGGGGAVLPVAAGGAGVGPADATERERVAHLAGFILNGALDASVRAKARELRVSRAIWNRNVADVLAVPVRNAQTGEWGYYNWTTTDRMAVANEVERILGGRRRRSLVPKWLKKQAKINKALKGLMGSVAAVKFKTKKRA